MESHWPGTQRRLSLWVSVCCFSFILLYSTHSSCLSAFFLYPLYFFKSPLAVSSHFSITHWPTVFVTYLRQMEVDGPEEGCACDYMFVCQCHSFVCAYLLGRILLDACVCACGLIVLLHRLLSSYHLTG